MWKFTIWVGLVAWACMTPSVGQAQVVDSVSRPAVMIVVEPNRTRVDGRTLRAAVTRGLAVIAVPVSFPNATESSAWIAVSAAADGKIAMRVRRTNGRGASRVERAPDEHTLDWLVDGVRWLLEASSGPASREHPHMASTSDLEQDIRHQGGEPPMAPTPSLTEMERDLAQARQSSSGGADALTAPTP